MATKPPIMNQAVNLIINRESHSFFRGNSKELWKTVTTVSNQGRMRGRAKGLMRIKDLNRGQKMGFGKNRMVFPGLTTAIKTKDGTSTKVEEMSKENYEQYLDQKTEAQSAMAFTKKGRKRQSVLERGWTSASPQGKKFGQPESNNPDGNFDEFDSILVEIKNLVKMSGVLGRTQQKRLCMISGNRNGLIGMATIQAGFGGGMASYRQAVNRAGKRVVFIDRYEDRTVYHDFFSQYGSSRLFVQQKPFGYGVSAHRLITAACELVGIKDIRVTIEGRTHNKLNILKAFLVGLLRQRTHQELANEKRLHLVEMRAEMGNFPVVVASPEDGVVRNEEEIGKDEILDFEAVSFDGNYARIRQPFQGLRTRWPIKIRREAHIASHAADRQRLLLEEGEIKSFLSDIYPECKAFQPGDGNKHFKNKKGSE